MHSILRQQEAQFVAVGGCGCLTENLYCIHQQSLATINKPSLS